MGEDVDIETEEAVVPVKERRAVKPFRRIKELIAAFNVANAQVQFAEAQVKGMCDAGSIIPAEVQREVDRLQADLDRALADLRAYKSRGKGKHPPFTRSVLSRRNEARSIYTPHQSLREKRRRALRAQREASR